jgi:hypothetical protein
MGSGHFDHSLYSSTSAAATTKLSSNTASVGSMLINNAKKLDAGYVATLVQKGNKIDPKLLEHGLRESRDNADHPVSNAIIIALDLTGSMGMVITEIMKKGLGVLFNRFYDEKPVTDPQVLFMGFDDVETQVQVPLQASQFESDNRIVQQLSDVLITGNGGGNNHESYHLPWYIAANNTSIDCYEKRGKKGYLFTVGDECPPVRLTKEEILRATGEVAEKDVYTVRELLEAAREKYHVFHVIIKEGSYARANYPVVEKEWAALMGQDVITVDDHTKLADAIVDVILTNEASITTAADAALVTA